MNILYYTTHFLIITSSMQNKNNLNGDDSWIVNPFQSGIHQDKKHHFKYTSIRSPRRTVEQYAWRNGRINTKKAIDKVVSIKNKLDEVKYIAILVQNGEWDEWRLLNQEQCNTVSNLLSLLEPRAKGGFMHLPLSNIIELYNEKGEIIMIIALSDISESGYMQLHESQSQKLYEIIQELLKINPQLSM